jgi:hypothetical protein
VPFCQGLLVTTLAIHDFSDRKILTVTNGTALVGSTWRKEQPMAQKGDVSKVANQVEDNPVLQIGARAGYAVSGVLHLLIAWIGLQIAWFASGKSADQSGALQTLAGSSLGRLTLWVAVLGFLALGLWQFANALTAQPPAESSP